MKLYTRRRMLAWSAGAIAACPLAVKAASQITPEQQRIMSCYPRYTMGEPLAYTDEHLKCLAAELRKHIPIEFEIVPGSSAMEAISAKGGDGKSRFLIGGKEDLFRLFEVFSYESPTTDDTLAKAAGIDGQQWLASTFDSASFYELEPGADQNNPAAWKEVPMSQIDIGEWPDSVAPNDGMHALFDYSTGGIRPEIMVATLDEADATNIPAFLRYGNWNECPPPEVHVAVHRYWRDLYGIELVSARVDTLEFSVAKPPSDRETALALAREQYAYCNDIVDQGVGTLANLAATLMVSDHWFFWWD